MLNRVPITDLNDFFKDLHQRKSKGVYFYRINGYTPQIHAFLIHYHEAARLGGVIIEGRLPNPDNNQLAYYSEMIGMDFRLDRGLILSQLHKWLPRMSSAQCENVAGSIYETLIRLQQAGKNENMLKNVYIKFMCWLYYKFERIVHQLGAEKLPKILYEGDISNYELLLMNVLCLAGCDIVLLQLHGDAGYLQSDPQSSMSALYTAKDMREFPQGFCLSRIRQEIQEQIRLERLRGEKPQHVLCTNAWMKGDPFEDIRLAAGQRSSDERLICNMLCRINGVNDKMSYENTLFQLQMVLKSEKRRLLIISREIPTPVPQESNAIARKNYQNVEQLIMDLSMQFRMMTADAELQKLMHAAFVDTVIEASRKTPDLNTLVNKTVVLLCWIKRYKEALFGGWRYPEISVFMYLGGCRNENEEMFCKYLSRLPVDVVLLVPDLNRKCSLTDSRLYEINNPESLALLEYPDEQHGYIVGTAAYHAERELDTLMYQDSGMYRNQQYDNANAVVLQTMYEEIAILWEQELKYRPSFSVIDGTVNMPVILAKISGVKDGNVRNYWQAFRSFITPDTMVIANAPKIRSTAMNPVKQYAPEFLRQGKLQRQMIRSHKCYQYGILRDATQQMMLDKIQLLIDQKIIRGTFENGMEYNIVATLLNLDKYTLRMIQKFDFTKQNPKIIYVQTKETMLSVEDTIYFSFMSLLGFDVLFFVPTGYQCFEQYLNRSFVLEHQIGEYMYDLKIPLHPPLSEEKRRKLREKYCK